MERSSRARRAGLLVTLLCASAALLVTLAGAALADSAGYRSYLDGKSADVSPVTTSGLLLAGGATDQDDAMARFVAQAGRGDIVVLDAWGKDSCEPRILGLGADSPAGPACGLTMSDCIDREAVELVQVMRSESGGPQWTTA